METIKKIDIHAHVIPDNTAIASKIDIKADELIEMYDRLNIEKGNLLPIVSPEGAVLTMTNEHIISVVKKYPDRFFWFCNIDPRALKNSPTEDLSSLFTSYKDLGAKGLGELTSNLYFDDPKMDNLLSHCEEYDMPVIFHISPTPNRFYGAVDDIGLPRLEKMLKKHPKLKFIGHSQPFWAEMSADITEEYRNKYPKGKVTEGRIATLLRKYDNLYCDLSAGSGANAMTRDPEYAVSFLNEFSDRIFYGCDICTASAVFPFTFSEFLENLRVTGDLNEENYRKICRENAIRIFDL